MARHKPTEEWVVPTNADAGKGIKCRVRLADDPNWECKTFLAVTERGQFITSTGCAWFICEILKENKTTEEK